MTRSQKEALKDFDAYELKNLEIENKKLTVINDDLLKVQYCPCKIFYIYSNSGNLLKVMGANSSGEYKVEVGAEQR